MSTKAVRCWRQRSKRYFESQLTLLPFISQIRPLFISHSAVRHCFFVLKSSQNTDLYLALYTWSALHSSSSDAYSQVESRQLAGVNSVCSPNQANALAHVQFFVRLRRPPRLDKLPSSSPTRKCRPSWPFWMMATTRSSLPCRE